VTKLFARVLKAEETLDDPYNSSRVDVDLLVHSMESLLQRCKKAELGYAGDQQDQIRTCQKLVTDLVCSFLENSQGDGSLRKHLNCLGLNAGVSLLNDVITSCEKEIDLTSEPAVFREIRVEPRPTNVSPLSTSQSMGPSKDFVHHAYSHPPSASSPRLEQGNCEGHSHLHIGEPLSPRRTSIGTKSSVEETYEARFSQISNRNNVSERLRQLRSRLQATELAVQTENSPPESKSHVASTNSITRQSRLSAPSPTRLSLPTPSRGRVPPSSSFSGSTTQSLRDRLVAAQDTRQGQPEPASVSSSMSRAAALRARLEAVKLQGNHNGNSK
jgi:hypothetical protein